jgi:hypothetical protein
MKDSFYYFFSATPQVLGGILALFVVFVIFKIQSLKSQIFGLGQTIIEEYRIKRTQSHTLKLNDKLDNSDIINELNLAIQRNSLDSLEVIICLIEDKEFELYVKSFKKMNSFLRSLTKEIIFWSVFTSLTIFFSLLIIPFGDFILSNKGLLNILFSVILICILICLSGVLLILKKSINEVYYFNFSWESRLHNKISEKEFPQFFKKK